MGSRVEHVERVEREVESLEGCPNLRLDSPLISAWLTRGILAAHPSGGEGRGLSIKRSLRPSITTAKRRREEAEVAREEVLVSQA